MRIINHSYQITPKSGEYDQIFTEVQSPLVGTYNGDYQDLAYDLFNEIIESLETENTGNRRMVVFNYNPNHKNCLSTLQFLMDESENHLIANFRSQHELYGRPYDEMYLNWVVQNIVELLKEWKYPVFKTVIHVNVADYHNYQI